MSRAVPRRRCPAPALAACLSLLLPAVALARPGGQAAPAPEPSALSIEHEAPGCLRAGKPARLAACFRPAAALARARVYFRAGGTRDWFYVEMSGTAPCLACALPKPKRSVTQVEYYVAATDRSFAESRTPERKVAVTEDDRCPSGPIAPVAAAASPVIGTAAGAAPVGFVTGGGGLSPLLVVGGVAVVGGGAAAVVAGGGGEGGGDGTTTTTLPAVTTTTSTSTTTTTTTLGPSPTTTTRPACETQPPTVTITDPRTDQLDGLSVEIKADASDPSPGSGVKVVRFYWQYCPGGVCGPQNLIGADTTEPYSAVWLFPSCGSNPEDRYAIRARAEDNCGNLSGNVKVDVRLVGRPCMHAVPGGAPEETGTAGSWVSELSVAGGRGQVVLDGSRAVFPAAGVETFSMPVEPGTHRFEATLVDGRGRPGTWRFDLGALGAVPGSLRVVAGEAASTAAAAAVFRLRGKPGERVVFTVEVGGVR